MARITWQNVDAPDLDARGAGRAAAALSLAAGMDSIGGIFSGIEGRRRAAADQLINQTALARAEGIQSVGAWDQAAANGGIFEALGLAPGQQATDEMMKLVLNRRDALEENRASDLNNTRDLFDHERDQFDHTRDVFDHSKDVYGFDRVKAEDARSDMIRQAGDEGLDLAYRAARESLNPEEASRIARDGASDPRVHAAAQTALTGLGSSFWSSSGQGIQDPTTAATVATIQADLDQRARDVSWQFGQTPLASLVDQAETMVGSYDSPDKALVASLNATVSGEDAEAFSQRKGEVTDIYRRMTADYPDIPQQIVAKVMENNLQGTSFLWLFQGDNVKLAQDSIRKELDKLNDPASLNSLGMLVTDYKRSKEGITSTRTQLDQLTSEIGILQDRPQSATRDAEIAKRQAKIQDLFQALGSPGNPSPAGSPEAALAADVRAALARGDNAAAQETPPVLEDLPPGLTPWGSWFTGR